MRRTSAFPNAGQSVGKAPREESRLSARQADRLLAISNTLLRTSAESAVVDAETLQTIASLLHAATHDALTGLPTRGVLLERLERELTRTADGQVAVLFVDLDNFKLVNDSLGHDSGDVVLREMARRIKDCVGQADTVSRFGGDEMVILHPGADQASEGAIGMRILAAMSEPILVDDREVVVSASVGVAISDRGAQTAEQLLRDADTALYSAKSRGRNRMERFNDELHARVARRVQIESDLRVALRDAQLFVHYQPQVNLQTGRVVGVEALVRWRHPELGMISPTEFIPVAEECQLIGALGRQVLRTACRQLAEWTLVSDCPLSMTVNVSPRQLDDPDFIAEVRDVLRATGIRPASLCLELTESALMDRETDTVAMLERIRAMGVYVAIDDFGTEYSSLARLRELPVEVLKIDRSFIDGLPSESGDTAIVTSILSLALAMGKHVIAEGVERPEQAAALRDMDCTVAQGYLFSMPVDPWEILPLLGRSLWQSPSSRTAPAAVDGVNEKVRRGHRSFIDEFLDHIGAPMGAKPDAAS
jgi:diguanylate cyclase (GGDEF)-like protein